jgi:formate dehydrogenase assembly factor FdhD
VILLAIGLILFTALYIHEMDQVESSSKEIIEVCQDCQDETPHSVSIELRVESDDPENAAFSREPYRVSTCSVCGTESILRLNNA